MKPGGILLVLSLVALGGCGQYGSPASGSGGTQDTTMVANEPEIASSGTNQTMEREAQPTMHAFTIKTIDGVDESLDRYKGKVVLVVNVASKCGFTPQYEGLEALYNAYKDKGLVVLGVPSNDFGQQEPGTEAEIKEFCTANYGVTFPMLSKVPVKNGTTQCELYQYLTQKSQNGVLDAEIAWNFNKILVGKDGIPIKYFESKVTPQDPTLAADIEAAIQS